MKKSLSWDARYDEGCLIITDLAPEQVTVYWYDLRQWAEQGFKDLKRIGWHWGQTKMTDPQRADQLWLGYCHPACLSVWHSG